MRKIFLTFFYSGLFPKAPGTAGTIAGAILGIWLLSFLPVYILFLLTILITMIAIKEIDKEEQESGIHDASSIVIDEVAGVWLAFSMLPQTMIHFILAIIFFRIFDIWKPSIIGRIDREVKGGLGVMGDDIVAGLFAGFATAIVYYGIEYLGLL
jgi:phosphatidylglycerophosphatase A